MAIISVEKRKVEQSNTINYLRAMAIILVVIHHSMSYGSTYIGGGGSAYSEFVNIINCVHVPLFFMISGYLCHSQGIKKYYKKKTFQLLVPFIVFTSAKLVFNLFFDQFSHSDSVGGEFLKAYVFGEYYWFSYSLFIMVLLAPLMWKLKNKFILVGSFSVLLLFNVLNGFLNFMDKGGPFQIFSVIIYETWFFLGYVLKQVNVENIFKKKLIKHILLFFGIAISTLVIFLMQKDILNAFLVKFILSLSISYVLLYIFSLIHFKILPLNYISRYSYQIFFLDSFVKVALFMVVSKFLTINIPIIILLAIVNVFISTIISITAYKIKFVKFLFGLS